MNNNKRLICGFVISCLSVLLTCIVIMPDTKTFSQGIVVTILAIIISVLIVINSVLED